MSLLFFTVFVRVIYIFDFCLTLLHLKCNQSGKLVLAQEINGKWLPSAVFGLRKCSAYHFPIVLYKKQFPPI